MVNIYIALYQFNAQSASHIISLLIALYCTCINLHLLNLNHGKIDTYNKYIHIIVKFHKQLNSIFLGSQEIFFFNSGLTSQPGGATGYIF